VGLRSINNVVDVTNFVMLETGQPLHAFDYPPSGEGTRTDVPTVIVRRAVDGEKFVTLDGKEHTLGSEHLLIADSEKGIALAGVMGGRNTEVNDHTVDVLLESAYFNPTNIRRTSKTLGIRTDSVLPVRAGRGRGMTDWVSRRAAQLILETAGGRPGEGGGGCVPVADAARSRSRCVTPQVSELLGLDF
jgi:phenylalanyl-tRNA synthetase beta chain